MRTVSLDQGWGVMNGSYSAISLLMGAKQEEINIPMDSMVGGDVTKDAPGTNAYGYYTAATKSYTKQLEIPKEWEKDEVWVHFDGVMGQAIPELNGFQFGVHHYGYTPFDVDLTDRVTFGGKDRFTVTVNPGQEPNSRWYPGQGLFRSVSLVHAPKIHIASSGIFARTERIEKEGDTALAYLTFEVTVKNHLPADHLVRVFVSLVDGETGKTVETRTVSVSVLRNSESCARLSMTVENPKLWNEFHPDLYKVEVRTEDLGIYRTHLLEDTADPALSDEDSIPFGIRVITWDSRHGLRINGDIVKLKGGCQHHDNGVIGTASYYDAEYRRLRLLKEAGYNAVRTSHNPPSTALLDAADRLGMYIFDEAFDIWNMAKTAGDYSLYFKDHWKEDLGAFIRRDRNHPSVVIWSTGNEIPERGGMTDGYRLAADLADFVRSLDSTRPVSNAICSYWSGLDDELATESLKAFAAASTGKEDVSVQNAEVKSSRVVWEDLSEPFAEHLDIVGYNYGEDMYEDDVKRYPDRVILGSESDPNHIDLIWKLVKKLPAVIGDFTWTSWDYIGEAGIGQSLYVDADDPRIKMGPFAVSSHASQFPWRTANDADFDITGYKMPQGVYRSIVWGSEETGVFSYDPAVYGKTEIVGSWGWPYVQDRWTWKGWEGKPVSLLVYSAACEVELFVNGKSRGKKPAGEENRFTARFDTIYEPGEVLAVSYDESGKEVSRSSIKTVGDPAAVRLVIDSVGTERVQGMNGAADPAAGKDVETPALSAGGRSLAFIRAEIVDRDGNIVPDAEPLLTASAEGEGDLLGFGSAAPVTDENYTAGKFKAYRGRAFAVLRSGYAEGKVTLTVDAGVYGSDAVTIDVRQ